MHKVHGAGGKRFFDATNRALVEPLTQGAGICKGRFQRARLTVGGMAVNIDVAFSAVLKSGNMRDVAAQTLSKGGGAGYGDADSRPAQFKGISDDAAANMTFQKGGKTASIVQYYRNTCNVKIRYPRLPCIDIGGGGNYIPMALCIISSAMTLPPSFSPMQIVDMIRLSAQRLTGRQACTALIRAELAREKSDPVAFIDSSNRRNSNQIRAQLNADSRASQEIILKAQGIMTDHLAGWHKSHSKKLPSSILIFQKGISEGQCSTAHASQPRRHGVRPSNDVGLHDAIGFTSDELQRLMNSLALAYCLATRSVSKSPLSYYSEVLCEKARLLVCSAASSSAAGGSGVQQPASKLDAMDALSPRLNSLRAASFFTPV
ncbi:hypothetical protein K437DRAFT_265907 [Tilletiaria anomala UBC 951]|uniref:PAZ domain-containing protein n=1 Tax=Tilletiaria anomala (strain ATCC 24038 / CBS 436.72 / UBC 951) TaxID=1037660 RepID=A0A066WQF7_TILAU|nr:uncharacterized protein K437DRAFT_265907 [Tilletiaria anomala UBC 951]KDN53249.1 hypothetical protein K437DRAFT_265907 [Tilletiaria anomala UBC 951]